ncbi:MAG: VOC family protein [Pseudomonadota bacterium]
MDFPDLPFALPAYEHVGIRVSDREEALAFYERLGWIEVLNLPEHNANEMLNASGVAINLIFNGTRATDSLNVLQDLADKPPGITHVAFVVDDLDALAAHLMRTDIAITEGPLMIGERRRVLFIRDPDGNVLEFDELLATSSSQPPL